MAESAYCRKDGFGYRCVNALGSRIHCDMADIGGSDDAVVGKELIMKTRKVTRKLLITITCIILATLLVIAGAFIRQAYISSEINDDYTMVLNNPVYQEPVSVNGVHFITQKISCGYAIIEMLSKWQNKEVTEQLLFVNNENTISTAMGTGFLNDLGKQFPEWTITRHTNLTNSELLSAMHETLTDGMPVPIEFAALRNVDGVEAWTLHFAVVTAMDLQNNVVIVQNPYGYEERYTVDSFLKATRYDSYENMELIFSFGFAFGLFHKNTIYTIQN